MDFKYGGPGGGLPPAPADNEKDPRRTGGEEE